MLRTRNVPQRVDCFSELGVIKDCPLRDLVLLSNFCNGFFRLLRFRRVATFATLLFRGRQLATFAQLLFHVLVRPGSTHRLLSSGYGPVQMYAFFTGSLNGVLSRDK
jgi:hypothetical protein